MKTYNDSRGLAPEGWHVPSSAEWQTLIDFLGGDEIAGGKMKEAGTDHWQDPNTGATNESGFSALPAGYRCYPGNYDYLGNITFMWSATMEYIDYGAWHFEIFYFESWIWEVANGNNIGLSVRCVKD